VAPYFAGGAGVGTIGEGATIRTGPHLAFELDVRYLGFLGSRDLNVGRYGVGISYVL
jgi:hypothetical protein